MRLIGVDMTSTPGPRSPITAASGGLVGDRIQVDSVVELTSWADYEALLADPGPWVAAIDHPFGLPAATVAALTWPKEWDAYMARVDGHPNRAAFRDALVAHRRRRPAGDKYQFRDQDRRVGAASPVNTQRPPVALMFYEGARRLAHAEVDVRPCRPRPGCSRVAVEGYPRLVARHWIDDRAYKGGAPADSHRTAAARRELLSHLASPAAAGYYGAAVVLDDEASDRAVNDWSGDLLDAVLCTAQAAWAHHERNRGYGVPTMVDPDEGWIVDPSTTRGAPRYRGLTPQGCRTP